MLTNSSPHIHPSYEAVFANKHLTEFSVTVKKNWWNYHSLPLSPVKIKQKASSAHIPSLNLFMQSFILSLALQLQWQNSHQCFSPAASDAWYHISLKTWKRSASLLRNPCSHEKGQDTMVYFISPKAFGRRHGSQCSVIFSFLSLLQGSYWQFSQIAVQHCANRAGITLWTSWIFKIWVPSLSLVVCLPPSQPWYPGPRSIVEPTKGLWSSCLGLANISQCQGNSSETFLLRSFPTQCYHGFGA